MSALRTKFAGLAAGLTALVGLAAAPLSAHAQDGGYRDWREWDQPAPPAPVRRPRLWSEQYDESVPEWEAPRPPRPRYVEPREHREPPRPRRYDDWQAEDDYDSWQRPERETRPRPVPNPAPAWKRESPPEPEVQIGGGIMDGGGRPYIAPEAPPRIAFRAGYMPGSIVIDTSARKLYYVTGPTSAFAYPIGVGREGFSWTGNEKVSRVADWPDWHPPEEMRKRKPELPEKMTGGIKNPLGAKAIYLGNTLYRIHGTNDPKSIGRAESSGCFRMMNKHVLHLASLVKVGTPVSVLFALNREVVASREPERQRTWQERPRWPRWYQRRYRDEPAWGRDGYLR